jgi:hypothetical protein
MTVISASLAVNIFGIKERINMKPQECNNAFEFKHTNSDGRLMTMTFEADTWPEVLENFMSFLQGSGWTYLTEKSVGINQKLHPNAGFSWNGETFWPDEDGQQNGETILPDEDSQEDYQIGCND